MLTFRDFTLRNTADKTVDVQFEPYGDVSSLDPGQVLHAAFTRNPESALFSLVWQGSHYDIWENRSAWMQFSVDDKIVADYSEIDPDPDVDVKILRAIERHRATGISTDFPEALSAGSSCSAAVQLGWGESVSAMQLRMRLGSKAEEFSLTTDREYLVEAISSKPNSRLEFCHRDGVIDVSEPHSNRLRVYTLQNVGIGMQEKYVCLSADEIYV